jgi:hypothetical protein
MPIPTPRLSHCHARTQSRLHISPLPSLYYAHTQSHSRTHAKDRLRTLKHVVFESYDELNKYLAAVESPLQMPVLASSAFLETQAVVSSLPPSQHNFSKNTPPSLPIPPLPSNLHDHITELIDMPRPSPSTRSSPSTPSTRGVRLAQAASMTLHISLLDRNPFLNGHAMTIPIAISGPSLRKYFLLLLPLYLLTLLRQPPYPEDVSLTLTHTHPCNSFHNRPSQITFSLPFPLK